MPLSRRLGLAALAALTTALLAPSASLAAPPSYDARDGACTGTEGVTVVVDLNPTSNATPAAPVHTRCVFGTPDNGIDALERAGFDIETSGAFGDPFVCVIEGLPGMCDPFGSGYWSYWKQDGTGWTFYDVGGFLARPQPGDVEGWRWVGDWATDPSDPPRVSPYGVKITSGPATTLTSGATASFTFVVPDAPDTTVLCRVDNGFWTACSSGTSHDVVGAADGTHTFTVRALDEFGAATLATRQFTLAAPAPVVVTPEAPPVVPASIGATSATVSSAHAASVTAAVSAGSSVQQVHVEFTSGSDRAAATRTATTAVAAGTSATPTFSLTGLASNTTFTYRVVGTSSTSVVATEWSTFVTPRVARRLKVATVDRFAARGERIVVRVERLGAGERVAIELGGDELGAATADEEGDAAVAIRIPVRARLGATALVAVGSGRDRTGRVAVIVTSETELRVTSTAARVAVRSRPRVTVSGLAPFEPVTLRWRGRVIADGTASRTGTFLALVPVGARPGSYALIATGSHATRSGSTTITVASATSRRRG